ncbi:hypothetical protein Y1Q_0005236 [Alligator mississippiensis]|uniref:Uncharacterized protein n=1 Tax=Alligator mississippiensis TaxID=8496 RepID=A0A151MT37_ALLMI|nr:hypothetical protein Y1Q_0005236 [Alligator mississippiensis]
MSLLSWEQRGKQSLLREPSLQNYQRTALHSGSAIQPFLFPKILLQKGLGSCHSQGFRGPVLHALGIP